MAPEDLAWQAMPNVSEIGCNPFLIFKALLLLIIFFGVFESTWQCATIF